MTTTDPAPHLRTLKFTTPAPTSPQSTLLSTLIAKSLTTLSYPPSSTSAVAALTHRNTQTITLTGLQPLLHHPSPTYGTSQALAQLFDNLSAKDVRINTNEPVLLVNSSILSNVHLKEIAAAAANSLRDQYHIRPVRIYAGNFDSASASELGTPKGFSSSAEGYSLSLLNVVNTDIGGPGMIQLMDMVDWEAAGAIKVEHWDGSGWNLVREVEYVGEDGKESAEGDGNGNRSESETGGSDKGEWESEDEAEPEEEDKEAEAEAEIGKEDDQVDALPVPDVPASHQEQDTDARPQLRSIKHPSWEHSQDKESLLDMISNQAKKLPVSKGGNAYATSAAAALEGEDGYEVI
jgi:hypothetical protein